MTAPYWWRRVFWHKCRCGALVHPAYIVEHEDMHRAICEWMTPPSDAEMQDIRRAMDRARDGEAQP